MLVEGPYVRSVPHRLIAHVDSTPIDSIRASIRQSPTMLVTRVEQLRLPGDWSTDNMRTATVALERI